MQPNEPPRYGPISEQSGTADMALSETSPYLGGAQERLSLLKDRGMSPKEPPR